MLRVENPLTMRMMIIVVALIAQAGNIMSAQGQTRH